MGNRSWPALKEGRRHHATKRIVPLDAVTDLNRWGSGAGA